VSPEISGNFLRKISGNLFQSFRKFPENFRKLLFPKNFTKNTAQIFLITVYLFTSSLSIGFYSTSVQTLFSRLIVLIGVACMVSLRSTLVPQLSVIFTISGNFLLELNFRKIYNPNQGRNQTSIQEEANLPSPLHHLPPPSSPLLSHSPPPLSLPPSPPSSFLLPPLTPLLPLEVGPLKPS